MRALAIVACLVAFAGIGGADEPKTDAGRIRENLASEDPKDVAWGLHDAIEGRVAGLDDLIRGLLVRPPTADKSKDRELRTWAIDAAIELDVALPAGLLPTLAAGTEVPRRLLLAARDPAGSREVLRGMLFATPDVETWMAAADLLIPLRDSVLTASLLDALEFDVRVSAADDDGGLRGGSRGRFSGSSGMRHTIVSRLEGWPPPRRWSFRRSAASGARRVATGPWPIYAERSEIGVDGYSCGPVSTPRTRSSLAPETLAALFGLDARKLRVALSEWRFVPFTSLEAWEKAIEDTRRTMGLRWLALVYAAWREGMLSPAALAGLTPRMTLTIDDARTVKVPPLPPVSGPRPTR